MVRQVTHPEPLIETVTTTTNPDGTVNCAAMGVRWGPELLRIRPFAGTRTLRNLRTVPSAVVHLTDDVLLFAQAALGDPHPPTRPAQAVAGAIIEATPAWVEVEVRSVVESAERPTVIAEIVARGSGRVHLGLNRARHAVVEASILASRLTLLDRRRVDSELERLAVLIEKTAGARERQAWELICRHVAAHRDPR